MITNGRAFLVGTLILNKKMNSQKHKINSIINNGVKYDEHKKFCNRFDVYKKYEGNDFNGIFEV